jgi:hypothetical protein
MTAVRDFLAKALDARDREAVLGDLSELGVSELRACAAILSLIGRRELSAWTETSAWLGLFALVVPTSLLLSYVSRWWADTSAVPIYLYVGNWTTAYLASPGARQDLLTIALTIFVQSLALIVWSALFGYSLGVHYRPTSLVAAFVALMLFLFGTTGTKTTAHLFAGNESLFADPVYGFWLPLFFRLTLVGIPAVVAMTRGTRNGSPNPAVVLGSASLAFLLVVFLSRQVAGAFSFGAGRLPGPGPDGIVGTTDDVMLAPWLAWGLTLPSIWLVAFSTRRHFSYRQQGASS